MSRHIELIGLLFLFAFIFLIGILMWALTPSSPKESKASPIVAVAPMAKKEALQIKKASPGWTGVASSSTIEDIEVKINEVRIGRPEAVNRVTKEDAKFYEDYLLIRLVMWNNSGTKKIHYRGLTPNTGSFSSERALLTDDLNNTYKHIKMDTFDVLREGSEGGSAYPHDRFKDILVFEVPVKTASHFDLHLPGDAFGVKGDFWFRFFPRDIKPAK